MLKMQTTVDVMSDNPRRNSAMNEMALAKDAMAKKTTRPPWNESLPRTFVPHRQREDAMNKDSAEGVGRQVFGQVEELAGRTLKDKQTSGQGIYDDAMGKAQTAYGNVKDAIASGAETATGDLAGLRDDISKLTQTVNKLVQSGASSARLHVMDAVGTAGENISQSASMAQEKIGSIEADVESRIKKNPWTAVAIAAALGILIGKLS